MGKLVVTILPDHRLQDQTQHLGDPFVTLRVDPKAPFLRSKPLSNGAHTLGVASQAFVFIVNDPTYEVLSVVAYGGHGDAIGSVELPLGSLEFGRPALRWVALVGSGGAYAGELGIELLAEDFGVSPSPQEALLTPPATPALTPQQVALGPN